MFTFGQKSTTTYKVNISIIGTPIDMEVDTDACLSTISEATYAYLQSQGKASPLVDTDNILRTYTWGPEEVRPVRGLYNYLPYGVAAAPGIFQRMMEQLLDGIPHVGVLLDYGHHRGRASQRKSISQIKKKY